MKALSRNAGGISDVLVEGPYREPALVPASPWLGDEAPEKPTAVCRRNAKGVSIDLRSPDPEIPWLWAIRMRTGNDWQTKIVAGSTKHHDFDLPHAVADEVIISAVSRVGIEGPAQVIIFKERG